MHGWLSLVKYGHVFVVGAGLLLFWVPLLTAKGGRFHRSAGRLYAAFMCVAGASGFVLAASYLGAPGKRVDAAFLLYALFVFFYVGRCAWRALAAKSGPQVLRTAADEGFDLAVIAGGAGALGLGLWAKDSFLITAGPLGALAGLRRRFSVRRKNPGPSWWLREHLGGMVATGALGYSALIFFELSRYFPASWSEGEKIAVWLSPSALGLAAAAWFLATLGKSPIRPR